MRTDPDRFPNYRAIVAKYPSTSTACGTDTGGHQIDAGDTIGWNRRAGGKTMCAACWAHWCAENDAEEARERSCPSYDDWGMQ